MSFVISEIIPQSTLPVRAEYSLTFAEETYAILL